MNEIKRNSPPDGIALCPPTAVLRVEGEDALTFLQGQFTQELRPDRAPAEVYGLWLNQKGRIVADSHALRLAPQQFGLVSWGSDAGVLRERLESYVIADDVTVTDETSQWNGWLLAGPQGHAWWAAVEGRPLSPGEWRAHGDGFAFASRRCPGALELLLPRATATHEPRATLPAEVITRERLWAGVPSIPDEFGPNDLPQEAGLETTAISFTKGCYLGQEVMARLHSMGRVRRRLGRITGRGAVPARGAALRQQGRDVGEIRASVNAGEGDWVGLAMLSMVNFKPDIPLGLDGASDVTWREQPVP